MYRKIILCIMLTLSLLFVGCGGEKIKESDELKTKVDKVINNEVGKKYEREITLIDDVVNGGKIVSINMDMKGKGRINLLSDAADIFKNLFEFNEVSETQIWYSADLVDTKGKTENISVMKIILKRETANDIGWDLFNVKNFPEVADEYWEHDVYKD